MYCQSPQTSSTEDIKGGFIDLPYVKERMENLTNHLVLGSDLGEAGVIYTDAQGNKIKVRSDLGVGVNDFKYVIPEQPSMGIIRHFKLPVMDNVHLNKMLLNQAVRYAQTEDVDYVDQAMEFVDSLSVMKLSPTDSVDNPEVQTLKIGRHTYAASKENKVAFKLMKSFDELADCTGITDVSSLFNKVTGLLKFN